MSIAKYIIFAFVLLEGCCLIDGALAQEPHQPKFFFQGAKTDVKPVRIGNTYYISVEDFAKLTGKTFAIHGDTIEVGGGTD